MPAITKSTREDLRLDLIVKFREGMENISEDQALSITKNCCIWPEYLVSAAELFRISERCGKDFC